MSKFNSPAETESKFNMALATLERMHNLMIASSQYSIGQNKNLDIVFDIELRLWNEVRPFTRQKDEDREKIDDLFKNLAELHIKYSTTKQKLKGNKRLTLINDADAKNSGEFEIKLREVQEEIRDLMDLLKLLLPKADDPRFAAFG